MRRSVIAGNWKMHMTNSEAIALVKELVPKVKDAQNVDVIVCPPFTALSDVSKVTKGTNIKLGAQDMSMEDKGAFTGEISPLMLKELGVKYILCGHSERRKYFHETNERVNRKIRAALQHEMTPVLCVGERYEERESGKTLEIIEYQILTGLYDVDNKDCSKIIVAYEPLWAIGTGTPATPDQIEEVHKHIRKVLCDKYKACLDIMILYGGSVKPDNIKELMAKDDVDGALVGGASLKPESFAGIVNFKS